jgi:hypothetical protein
MIVGLSIAALLVLGAFSVFAARRASYHQGKSDAFQQVADDFTGLSRATWMRDRDRQRQERKKAMLNLCLCDPAVCEALAEALTEARAHWHHRSSPAYDGLEKPPERVGTSPKEAA